MATSELHRLPTVRDAPIQRLSFVGVAAVAIVAWGILTPVLYYVLGESTLFVMAISTSWVGIWTAIFTVLDPLWARLIAAKRYRVNGHEITATWQPKTHPDTISPLAFRMLYECEQCGLRADNAAATVKNAAEDGECPGADVFVSHECDQ